jgi:ketosteroid isomerase-like protein
VIRRSLYGVRILEASLDLSKEPGAAMTQSTPTTTVDESAEIERIVREWFRSYSEKDFEAHNALIHPDAVVIYPEMCFVDPDMSAGRDFLVKTLEKDEANFLDLRQTVTNLWIVGNAAFVEGYFSGTKLGGTIVDDATGSEMKLRFLHHMEIEDGMVKLMHAYYDTALLYQIQLGLQGPTKENPIAPWMLAMAAGEKPSI